MGRKPVCFQALGWIEREECDHSQNPVAVAMAKAIPNTTSGPTNPKRLGVVVFVSSLRGIRRPAMLVYHQQKAPPSSDRAGRKQRHRANIGPDGGPELPIVAASVLPTGAVFVRAGSSWDKPPIVKPSRGVENAAFYHWAGGMPQCSYGAAM